MLIEKYKELNKELITVKKQMVFDFSNYLFDYHKITLSIKNGSIHISDSNNNEDLFLIHFFNDEFKDYHFHAGVLFELSEYLSRNKKEQNDFDLNSFYFLNFFNWT